MFQASLTHPDHMNLHFSCALLSVGPGSMSAGAGQSVSPEEGLLAAVGVVLGVPNNGGTS